MLSTLATMPDTLKVIGLVSSLIGIYNFIKAQLPTDDPGRTSFHGGALCKSDVIL